MKFFYSFVILFLLTTPFTSVVAQGTDYIQVVLYGQSLGLGWQSPRAITKDALYNNYMTGSNVNTKFSSGATVLNPLVATKWTSGGEQPIVSCLNAYSEAYRANINANQKFIAVTAGHGGQTIEMLSKECTNDGYYESTFIKSLDNTLAAINGQTVSCPAIIYMQGEYNAVASAARGKGLTPGTNGTSDKTVYKELLLKLKNNMQTDIMEAYSQKEKPLFFIYQTSGSYIKIKDMPIVMAQIEFAEENIDVVLLNPHYAMPDYTGGHLSTNGYRWYGELMSKSLIKELVNNSPAETLKPTNFDVSGQKITIDYSVPVPPLVLDTWTTPMQSNYGFQVYKDGGTVNINSVEIISDNQVEITCSAFLEGNIEIAYAGPTVNGSGNLRDSDLAVSMYTYFNDSSDSLKESYTPKTQSGGSIYGEPYGMQNWSNMFYYNLGYITPSNLALGKNTSQSSTAYGGESLRAVDGNVSGAFYDNSVSHTANGTNNPWWEVDLGATYAISDIVVYGRTDDCCKEQLSNFTLSLINNGTTTFSQTYKSYPNPSVSVNLGNAEGNTIRVQLNGIGGLALAEVEVYGVDLLSVSGANLNQVEIFPNPMNTNFTITNSLGSVIEIYNVVGEIMMIDTIQSNTQSINISNFNSGLYFIRVKNNENIVTSKKIIKK